RSIGEWLQALRWACPMCRQPLTVERLETLHCLACRVDYPCVDGIWRFPPPERAAFFQAFLRDYETIRRAEGRDSDDPVYYRALPFEDRTGRFRADWRIRAKSFQVFVCRVLDPWLAIGASPCKSWTSGPAMDGCPIAWPAGVTSSWPWT
ncbi:MAG: hypothetical protein NZ742_10240, partial [Acidobacteria bacterium]|nr:hypothetical protein [Acidobacteriota bacterium]MDW7985115.1 hypothetical protein [Acidobacteriota bacterium]